MNSLSNTINLQLGAKQIAVLEDAGAVVIDRYKIPIYAHARGVNLSAQSFLLQDPWYVEVCMNYALDSFSTWFCESYELVDCGNTNKFFDLTLAKKWGCSF
jgi:hypothetical protein